MYRILMYYVVLREFNNNNIIMYRTLDTRVNGQCAVDRHGRDDVADRVRQVTVVEVVPSATAGLARPRPSFVQTSPPLLDIFPPPHSGR